MDEKMKTVDVARKLIDVMVDFYDPVEDEDPDFGYTYKEHLQGSAADKGKGKAQGEEREMIALEEVIAVVGASQRLKDKHKETSPMPSPSGSDRSSMDV
ncbi:hypothetical protein F5J12DRAFT_897827 [Pisolithus orientalis]|uniref:uncharacterized protein n=1 Tax=Pisolithus orientalis TaxID=936130 RepID=UPI0022255061|nr:uncharacterized protein F5J12DRAFT_897827 [Pisolithus orientalis]KAI5989783.1 hypothetical protein F5J12DRAFT_897827 [Pisolithus orientalis]